MCSLKKVLIYLSRIRQSLGFGVHSPFVYQLIVDVFYERLPFYAYDYLKKVKAVKGLPGYSMKINRLLFRLVNYFHPSDIVEFGTGNGMSVVWMSSAKRCDSVVTFDESLSCNNDLNSFFSEYPAIEHVTSFSMDKLRMFLAQRDEALHFVHIAHTDQYKEIFELLLDKVDSGTVMIIEDIDKPLKNKWWKEIEHDQRVGITIDLYKLGIILFDKEKHTRRAYKLIF